MNAGTSTRPLGHLDFLDGWRGIAIALVLVDHLFDIRVGRTGVEVFLVLSGLLMSRILFETDISIGTFYRRRIARIVPVLVLYLTAVSVWAAFALPAFPWRPLLWNLALLQSYMPEGIVVPELPISHFWSLNVEEHSYVLLSVLALGTRRRMPVILLLASFAIGCVAAYLVYLRLGIDGTRRTECAAFALLASAALHLALRGTRYAGRWLAVGAIGLLVCLLGNRLIAGSILIGYVAKPFCLALIVNTLHAAPRPVLAVLSLRWLRWLGVTSFSLYVWQQPFYHAVGFLHVSPWLGLGGALAVGALSYYAFEVPMRRMVREGRTTRVASRFAKLAE